MEKKEDIKPDFGSFLERHRPFIWKLCNKYADGNLDVGLDYVQEVTTILWTRYHCLREGSTLEQESSWIKYIVREYFNKLSQRKKPDIVTFSDLRSLPVVIVENSHLSELLADYMECLTPQERAVADLYVQGYSLIEMAKILEISPEAARQRLHRAIAHMSEYAKEIDNI